MPTMEPAVAVMRPEEIAPKPRRRVARAAVSAARFAPRRRTQADERAGIRAAEEAFVASATAEELAELATI